MEISPASSLGSIQVRRIHGAIRPVAPASAVTPLTAGSVRTPADPALAPGLAHGETLQLYGRAADRIEAATAVRLGRIVDQLA